MITLDDRLRDSAADIRQAATRVPVRPVTTRRGPVGRGFGWAVAAAAALIAIPLWLGAIDGGGALPVGEDPSPMDDVRSYLGGGADAIAFLADDVSVDRVASLVEEIRLWDGVAGVMYVSKETALVEFRELFADQPALLEIVEGHPDLLPASIRLILTADADPEVRYVISTRLRSLPGVVRGSLRDTDDAAASPPWFPFEWVGEREAAITRELAIARKELAIGRELAAGSLLDIVGGEPVDDTDLPAHLTGPPPVSGTVRLVAAQDQEGLGVISLFVYEVPAEPQAGIPEGPWYCLSTVWSPHGGEVGDVTQCGHTTSFMLPAISLLIACPSDGVEQRIVSITALNPTGSEPSTATLLFDDGTTASVDVTNGTILMAWVGTDRYPTRVDAGDTTILDPLRSSSVTSGC